LLNFSTKISVLGEESRKDLTLKPPTMEEFEIS